MKFQIKRSVNDKWYFVLKANNHQTIVVSEMYESKQNCKHGIKIVKRSIFSRVEDLSKEEKGSS